MRTFIATSLCLASLVLITGCGQETETPTESSAPAIDGTKYLLTEEPADAAEVAKAREDAKSEDEVVAVGRIGGSAMPWVEGQAAFYIIDSSLKACNDIEGDNCPQPWDYCCESSESKKSSMVLVKVVDESGKTVKADARKLLKLKELQTVVVKGTVQRDEEGNVLALLTKGVYVKQ